jgi:hypothetical protein
MSTSTAIKEMAPAHAVFFRLKLPYSDGSSRDYPVDGAGYYTVGESPFGLPSNQYFVQFYDQDKRPIQHKECPIRIDGSAQVLRSSGQLNLHLLNANGTAAKLPLPAPHPPDSPAAASSAPLDPQELELRRHMQAMDLEERQQEFIKGSAYVTELGEAFTLNRLMRRDMLELHRIIVEHSQRAFQDIDQVKSTVHELLAMQKAVLEHAASAIARPPPPPPDYVGLGHSALAVVKDLGAALITRSLGRELVSRSHALEGDVKAQLGDGDRARDAVISPVMSADKSSAEKSSADKSSPDKPTGDRSSVSASMEAAPRDAMARMVSRLHGLSEAELAMAMSSVEGWKSLLDSLRSDGAKGSAMGAESAKSAGEPAPAAKS